MVEEIAFEAVDHRDLRLEHGFIGGTLHQQPFRAEHFGYLGQDRLSACLRHPIGDTPDQRIGGEAAEPVRPAAFQARPQGAKAHRFAPVLRGKFQQFIDRGGGFAIFVGTDLRPRRCGCGCAAP